MFNLFHDFRIQIEETAIYLFDAENKIIAVFPQEKRDWAFFKFYVSFLIRDIDMHFHYEYHKYKRFYRRMNGHNRRKAIHERIDKFELKGVLK